MEKVARRLVPRGKAVGLGGPLNTMQLTPLDINIYIYISGSTVTLP